MLLKSVFTVFQRAVESAEATVAPYLALNQPPFDPESIPARQRYLARRQKLLNNLIRWRKYTGERFGIGMLLTNLVNNCTLPVAESGWDVGGEERMRKVRRFRSVLGCRAYTSTRLPTRFRTNLSQLRFRAACKAVNDCAKGLTYQPWIVYVRSRCITLCTWNPDRFAYPLIKSIQLLALHERLVVVS